MKVLFLCLYPENTAPSQRFRFEQFFPYFKEAGVSFDVDCFYSRKAYSILYQKGKKPQKAWLIMLAYLKRLFKLSGFRAYDYIFIQRGASPIGPPVFEYILARVFGKKIIYDFDDSIWMPEDGKGSKLYRWLKSYSKVGKICKWAYHVSVGNGFLADYVRQFTSNVSVIPTVVDTEKRYLLKKKSEDNTQVTVGWTGSHSTLHYLLTIQDVLFQIATDERIRLLVIANKKPKELEDLKMCFITWNKEQEIEDLAETDIGLMPLLVNDWTKGKCGFKAIQYMALGIPALVSPVGVNPEIVDDGINGFMCTTADEWMEKITLLAEDPELRARMGQAARKKIESEYSVKIAFPMLLSLIKHNHVKTESQPI